MLDVLGAIHARRGQAAPARPGADDALRVTGYLHAVDEATYTATVAVYGSEPIPGVPCNPSTYTGVTGVHVLMKGGRPVLVTGPSSEAVISEPPPPATPPEETVRTVKGKVITPVGSGTYRTDRGAWDRWNDGTHPYQGTSFSGAGPLLGLAWYGDQITALGADEITKMTLRLVSNGSPGAGSWVANVQGCASGSRPGGAPSYSGDVFTGTVPSSFGGVVNIAVPSSVREGLRTGARKSLGLPAGTYGGTVGAPSSWVLTADYKVIG